LAFADELMLGFEGSEVAHKLSAKSSPILSSFLINVMERGGNRPRRIGEISSPMQEGPRRLADGAGLPEGT
jgi:hypothetical protein